MKKTVKLIKPLKINVDIFKSVIYFVYSKTEEDYIATVKKYLKIDLGRPDGCAACYQILNNSDGVIWCPKKKFIPHECLHATFHILDSCLIQAVKSDGSHVREVFCYLQGFLIERIETYLKKIKKYR